MDQIRLLLTLFVKEASETFQQTTKTDNFFVIGALRVNKCEFSVQCIYCQGFHEMHTGLRGLNSLLALY